MLIYLAIAAVAFVLGVALGALVALHLTRDAADRALGRGLGW